MKFVNVDKQRFFDIMDRCGAYVGNTEKGSTHYKELFCRNLSVWQGEIVVGVFSMIDGQETTYSVAGYLESFYK